MPPPSPHAAPLLAVTPLPALTRAGLSFPAKTSFQQLRGYPTNRGMVGPELSSIRQSLGRVYSTAHEACKRVAMLKVGGCFGCG